MEPRAIRPNPGGSLAPDQVVGRLETIDELWRALEVQSVRFTAERRVGKTSILRKMEAQPRPGFRLLYRDIENISSVDEFVRQVLEDAIDHLPAGKKAFRRVQAHLPEFKNVQVKDFKIPEMVGVSWSRMLDAVIGDLCEQQETKLVFAWDEFPYFLQNLIARGKATEAIQVLDQLRSIRNNHPDFRLVLTGSIGLQMVLSKLQDQGHSNPSVNDLKHISLFVLKPAEGKELAERLCLGIQLVTGDQQISEIADSVGNHPFLMHHLVDRLRLRGSAAADDIEASLESMITETNDPLQFDHYAVRLEQNYPEASKLAFTILDVVAVQQPITLAELVNSVLAVHSVDEEQVRKITKLLVDDHYIVRTSTGYSFTLPLLRRWWIYSRELS